MVSVSNAECAAVVASYLRENNYMRTLEAFESESPYLADNLQSEVRGPRGKARLRRLIVRSRGVALTVVPRRRALPGRRGRVRERCQEPELHSGRVRGTGEHAAGAAAGRRHAGCASRGRGAQGAGGLCGSRSGGHACAAATAGAAAGRSRRAGWHGRTRWHLARWGARRGTWPARGAAAGRGRGRRGRGGRRRPRRGCGRRDGCGDALTGALSRWPPAQAAAAAQARRYQRGGCTQLLGRRCWRR